MLQSILNRHFALASLFAIICGCNANVTLKPTSTKAVAADGIHNTAGGGKIADQGASGTALSKPSPAATPIPLDALKWHIPQSFGIGLPSSLTGGSVISNDGASVISNDGSSVISNDGSSVISNDGASFSKGVTAFNRAPGPQFGLLSETVYLSPGAAAIKRAAQVYEWSRATSELLIQSATAHEDELREGKTVDLTSLFALFRAHHHDNGIDWIISQGGPFLTLSTTSKGEGILHYWMGSGDKRQQILNLIFDENQERGVMNLQDPKRELPIFACTFDLKSRSGSADARFYEDGLAGTGRFHWNVVSYKGDTDTSRVLGLKVQGYLTGARFLDHGQVTIAANVLKNNTASAIYADRSDPRSPLQFRNSALEPASAADRGIFLNAAAQDIPATAVTNAQRAALPRDEDLDKPTFDASTESSPSEEEVFKFP